MTEQERFDAIDRYYAIQRILRDPDLSDDDALAQITALTAPPPAQEPAP